MKYFFPGVLLVPLGCLASPSTPLSNGAFFQTDTVQAVQTFADNMLAYGRDHYGPEHTPMFVNQLDIHTRSIPEGNRGMWYTPKDFRMGASQTGSNFHYDTGLMRVLLTLSVLTGDARYRQAVTDALDFVLTRTAVLPVGYTVIGKRFVLPGGDHLRWDVIEDRPAGAFHETKNSRFLWETMYELNPEAVTREIDTQREHVLNPGKNYGINRHWPFENWIGHASRTSTLTLPSSAGIYLQDWAFLYSRTGNAKYLEWIRGLSGYLWDNRGKNTGIIPSAGERRSRNNDYDTPDSRIVYGQEPWRTYVSSLLYTARTLDDTGAAGQAVAKDLREQSETSLLAWSRYMMTPQGAFHYAINIDTGLPITPEEAKKYRDYGIFSSEPVVEIWGPRARWHQIFATLAFSYRETRLKELRPSLEVMSKAFASPEALAESIKASSRDMSLAILAWTYLYEANGHDLAYLDQARPWVEAVLKHYFREGFFVSGPLRGMQSDCDPWSIYSNRSGSAYLAYAVLRYQLLRDGKNPEALAVLGDDVVVDM